MFRLLQRPDIPPVPAEAEDGVRAQQKVYGLLRGRRNGGGESTGRSIALSEPEVNALLQRHLADATDLPLEGSVVRLPDHGTIEFAGRVPLGRILAEPPLSAIRDALPARWIRRPVWVHLRAHARLESGEGQRRYIRLDVGRFSLGEQRLPAALLPFLFNPTTLRVLRWQVPPGVESVTIEPGRVVIKAALPR
ncbi:MAG: hypothetical protein HY727_03920 [Candidatus Rokubacteria bacterium]|nr:hypothetical protein [Candidatus Rokubacteria bacterium]